MTTFTSLGVSSPFSFFLEGPLLLLVFVEASSQHERLLRHLHGNLYVELLKFISLVGAVYGSKCV